MREKATEKAINRSECKRNSKVVLGEAGAEVEEHRRDSGGQLQDLQTVERQTDLLLRNDKLLHVLLIAITSSMGI